MSYGELTTKYILCTLLSVFLLLLPAMGTRKHEFNSYTYIYWASMMKCVGVLVFVGVDEFYIFLYRFKFCSIIYRGRGTPAHPSGSYLNSRERDAPTLA